jgi:hypothetical protein
MECLTWLRFNVDLDPADLLLAALFDCEAHVVHVSIHGVERYLELKDARRDVRRMTDTAWVGSKNEGVERAWGRRPLAGKVFH